MATFPWFPFYVGDYLRDTSRLTVDQHGAYLLLLFDEWANGPLPTDDAQLALIARVPAERWPGVWRAVSAFFRLDAGHLVNPRLEAERAKVERLSEAGRAGANKRWNKEKNRVPSKSHPNRMRTAYANQSQKELIQGKQDASASSLSSDSGLEGKVVTLRGRS